MAARNLFNVLHDQRNNRYVVYRGHWQNGYAMFAYTQADKAQAMEAAFDKRKELNAEAAEASAAKKAGKAAQAKTCQCCGRQIFAETGTIAHHGYERPGYGYQTASCMGAKYLPFEADRARLGDLIGHLKDRLADQTALRRLANIEQIPVQRTYGNYNAPRVIGPGTHRRGDYPTVDFAFTRANFKELVDQHTGQRDQAKLFDSYTALCMLQSGFDKIKAQDLDHRDHQIKMTGEHLAECGKRYAGWEQTHRWTGETWEGI